MIRELKIVRSRGKVLPIPFWTSSVPKLAFDVFDDTSGPEASKDIVKEPDALLNDLKSFGGSNYPSCVPRSWPQAMA